MQVVTIPKTYVISAEWRVSAHAHIKSYCSVAREDSELVVESAAIEVQKLGDRMWTLRFTGILW
jgi:hypothetical protein